MGGCQRLAESYGATQPASKVHLLCFRLLDERMHLKGTVLINMDPDDKNGQIFSPTISCFKSARSAGFFIKLQRRYANFSKCGVTPEHLNIGK